ncbi:hypothetical protein FB45DRAFT_930935 [Roridomyces roridus]|uniref:DUF6533 domain-containing protein n=1 Tax=Roridomyces roridus TaxID=1738132 RepID=A0AAD7FGU3_9AGAR|nr:hypothetical protein FB45DRAFT_930935 [Roridomyces roridus]
MDAQSYPLLSQLQVVSYIKAGFLALFTYDTLLQIQQEYLYIWKARWTLVKFLYLWTRYSPFIGATISVVHSSHPDFSKCNDMFTIVFGGFGIGITDLILIIRTYTLYERSKRLLVFFFFLFFSVGGVSFWAITKMTGSSHFRASNTETTGVASCYFTDAGTLGIGLVCYISLLAGELVIILLTLWKMCRKFSQDSSGPGILTSLYRDGIWFYLGILPFTIATVIISFIAPPGLSDIASAPVAIMHSVLVCHLITHTRGMAAKEDQLAYDIKERAFRYGSDVVLDISPENKV